VPPIRRTEKVSSCVDAALPLYLELRALRLEVRAEDDPDGDVLGEVLRLFVRSARRVRPTGKET